MNQNRTEQCHNCGNVTVGIFQTSDIRKLIKYAAKEGGMKAVLGIVGNMGFPIAGGVSGFMAGTVIDLKYGDDINQFADKVADWVENEKKYTFRCPNCGEVWTRQYDEDEKSTFKEILSSRNIAKEQIQKTVTNFSKKLKKLPTLKS